MGKILKLSMGLLISTFRYNAESVSWLQNIVGSFVSELFVGVVMNAMFNTVFGLPMYFVYSNLVMITIFDKIAADEAVTTDFSKLNATGYLMRFFYARTTLGKYNSDPTKVWEIFL